MDVGSITSAAMTMTQHDSLSKVGVAVLSKALQNNESMGEGLVNMIDSAAMERSVNPAVGSNIDVSV